MCCPLSSFFFDKLDEEIVVIFLWLHPRASFSDVIPHTAQLAQLQFCSGASWNKRIMPWFHKEIVVILPLFALQAM
jgi:hypothetical protein